MANNPLAADLPSRAVIGGALQPVIALIHPQSGAIEIENWDDYLTALADGGALDAFSRQRVSSTGQRFDSTFTYDKQPLLFSEVVAGTGAATHDANLRSVYLSTGGTASGARAELRQRYDTPYTPGNSQFIAITGTLNPDGNDWTNARGEIGYGHSANGVGFRYDENGASIFVRSSISGTPADLVSVPQASWNRNKAVDVDWTKSQIFLIDFQSLAVGRIRFYLDRGGTLVEVHEVVNDNIRVGPYWQLGNHPIYWSVENTGIANETCRILAICATVKSEGGQNLADIPGFPFSASRSSLLTVSTTLLPVLSIRVQTTFNSLENHMLIWPEFVDVYSADQPAIVKLVLNPTLSNASFAQVNANSAVYADVSATALSGGTVISTFFVPGATRGYSSKTNIAGRMPLGVMPGPTGDILTVAALRAGAVNAAVIAAIDWKEVR